MELENNNNMDEQVKATFDNFAPPVPADLWDKIEKQLDVPQSIENKPIRRIMRSYSIYGGAIAATLIVAFAFWKFQKNETIELKPGPEVYASKIPLEGNRIGLESMISDEQVLQEPLSETLLEVGRIAAVKKPTVAAKLTSKSMVKEVNLANSTSLASTLQVRESNTVHVESAFSLSVAEAPLAIQEVLPLESKIIALQESISLQGDVQASLVEEDTSENKKIGVSTVLNFLAKSLSKENGKSIEFSESDEGILKIDLKLGFAKSND